MIDRLLVGVAALALVSGAPALASTTLATLQSPGQVVTKMTYTTEAGVADGLTGGSYSGVGGIFIATKSTATTGIGSLCTGAMLSARVVLTAAHCLTSTAEDPITKVSFYIPSYGEATLATTYNVGTWTLNPGYDGNVLNGGDFALMTLTGGGVSGVDYYGIYDGFPLDNYTRVGTGTVGGPQGTGTGGVTQDYYQREGKNIFEYFGSSVGIDPFILLSDFDDGTTNHDVFGRIGGDNQTGIAGESNSSGGDSGGPIFIDGKIVAVTSFGVTGDALRDVGATCGTVDSIDPYADTAGRCTNSSVGELMGDTWLLPYQGYIEDYVRLGVPEPATWLQMIAGFSLLGSALRGRTARVRLRVAV